MLARIVAAAVLGLLSLICSEAYEWKGLDSYDAKNYMCLHFEDLCENFLEEIGCGTNTSDYKILGCPGYPTVPNNISHFKGICTCYHPVLSTAAGGRITNEIISNRLVPEMGWILEPWQTGPPYDYALSYTKMCSLLLDRLGCPDEDQTISTNTVTGKYKCSCGTLTTADSAVQNIMIDQINKLKLTNMPIFSNPVYLSTSLSICMVLILGKLGAILACYFKLPAILGYILVGLGMQNFLNPMILKGVGFPYPSVSSELKLLALTLVLMRAGLAVDLNDIKKSMVPTVSLALIPYISEFFAFTYTGVKLFGWSQIEMGLFGSMMSALGPSVVIPPMLALLSSTKKNYGYIPKQVLLCAPLEAVIAVVLFSIFTILNQQQTDPYYPWVKVLPLYANCLLIPVNIAFSCVMGIILGYVVSRYINFRVTLSNDFDWMRINKNIQMGSSTADLIFVLLVACYTMMSLCTKQYIQQSSGVLVVFVCCVTISIFCDKEVAKDIASGLKGIWVFAEVFLFTFVGTNLALDPTNGPLIGQRGMSVTSFKDVIGCMLVGTCARFIGHVISAGIVTPTMPEHRRNVGWMGRYAFSAWTFQLPKATVQATLGGVAYTMAIIPGPQGLNRGLIMLQSSAITILIFASLGTLIATHFGAPTALHCSKLDLDAGWDNKRLRYFKTSQYYKGDGSSEPDADAEDSNGIELTDTKGHPKHYTMSAAGFIVPDEDDKRQADTFFDLVERVTHPVPAATDGRRRSLSSGIKYVLTGQDDEAVERSSGVAQRRGSKESVEGAQRRASKEVIDSVESGAVQVDVVAAENASI